MKYIVTLTYEVDIEGDEVTPLHLLDAVYNSHVGKNEGVTDVSPRYTYKVEETLMSYSREPGPVGIDLHNPPWPCSEPGGNEMTDGRYAHDLMIEQTGQCPWCGKEE
jgi:hypothetical protein